MLTTRLLKTAAVMALCTGVLCACSSEEATYMATTGYISPAIVTEGADAPPVAEFSLTLRSSDGEEKNWAHTADFNSRQAFLTGSYTLRADYSTATTEGFDKPYWSGETTVTVIPDATVEPTVRCSRRSVGVTVTADESFVSMVSNFSAWVHAVGGAYFDCSANDAPPLYVIPGTLELYLRFTLTDGRSASLMVSSRDTAPGADIAYTISGAPGEVTVTDNEGSEERIALSDELFNTAAPEIAPIGFKAGEPLAVSEGGQPDDAVAMEVLSYTPLRKLMLTITGATLPEGKLTMECDLLSPTAAQSAAMQDAGVELTVNANRKSAKVTLTKTLELLRRGDDNPSISLIAVDCLGQVSEPLQLTIEVQPAHISLVEVENAVMGAVTASAIIRTDNKEYIQNTLVELSDDDGESWEKAEITGSEDTTDGCRRLTFRLPQERVSNLDVRFSYMGTPFGEGVIEFLSPSYTIEADAFAYHLVVRVSAKTESERRLVTRTLRVFCNGSPSNVYLRDESAGILYITGLASETTYSVTATVFTNPGPSDFTPAVVVRTESTPDLPNKDFEETELSYSCQDFPSGGTYSQNAMPLYNRQNRVSYEVNVPKQWANVNAKTFCINATNQNTWYMQPSTLESADIISGTVSVQLRSVAFDPAGEPIEPYRQLTTPFIYYNPNVPHIRYRAAGKIFLGAYDYNPGRGETYEEGIPFGARPSGISGTYRYIPGADAPEDCGRVDISVLGRVDGELVTIAESTGLLYPATTPSAFSVPLVYSQFGVKGEVLRVMISSSRVIGTIEQESAGIITSPHAANGASIGSSLVIDGLSLTY